MVQPNREKIEQIYKKVFKDPQEFEKEFDFYLKNRFGFYKGNQYAKIGNENRRNSNEGWREKYIAKHIYLEKELIPLIKDKKGKISAKINLILKEYLNK